MVKRQAAKEITAQKHQIIAALYSNTNLDGTQDEPSKRPEVVKEIESHFNRAVEQVYHPERFQHDDNEPDWDNPFWAAAKRAYDRQKEMLRGTATTLAEDVGTVQEAKEIEERAQARSRMRSSLDQLRESSK